MGGMSLNPLGEEREFNSGLLKPKKRSYHYLVIMGIGWLFSHRVLRWTLDLAFLKELEN